MFSKGLERKLLKVAYANLSKIRCKHRHFTFIMRRNAIIAFGYNQVFKSHPIANKFLHRFSDVHSELAAILQFPYPIVDLKKYQMINMRIRRDNGKLGMAKPCSNCIKMLSFFDIKSIIYTNREGEWTDSYL